MAWSIAYARSRSPSFNHLFGAHGNRDDAMRWQSESHVQGVAETSGDRWDVGAIGNAEWTGVSLKSGLDGNHQNYTLEVERA